MLRIRCGARESDREELRLGEGAEAKRSFLQERERFLRLLEFLQHLAGAMEVGDRCGDDRVKELVLDGFRQIVECAGVDPLFDAGRIGERSENNDGDVLDVRLLLHPPEEFDAAHSRHHPIEDHCAESFMAGLEDLLCIVAVVRCEAVESLQLERLRQERLHCLIVVDDEDAITP